MGGYVPKLEVHLKEYRGVQIPCDDRRVERLASRMIAAVEGEALTNGDLISVMAALSWYTGWHLRGELEKAQTPAVQVEEISRAGSAFVAWAFRRGAGVKDQ